MALDSNDVVEDVTALGGCARSALRQLPKHLPDRIEV
jgi:hypothetical protein